MGKQLSRKQLAQRAKDRRASRKTRATTSPVAVNPHRDTGGKRKGKSMKVAPATERATRITTTLNADALAREGSLLYGDKKGNGKLIVYYQ